MLAFLEIHTHTCYTMISQATTYCATSPGCVQCVVQHSSHCSGGEAVQPARLQLVTTFNNVDMWYSITYLLHRYVIQYCILNTSSGAAATAGSCTACLLRGGGLLNSEQRNKKWNWNNYWWQNVSIHIITNEIALIAYKMYFTIFRLLPSMPPMFLPWHI